MKIFFIILILINFTTISESKSLREIEEIIVNITDDGADTVKSKISGSKTKKDQQKKNKDSVDQKKTNKKKKKRELIVPSRDESLLKNGIQLFNSQLYEKARSNLEELKTKYSGSRFRDSASIWISRIHSEQGMFDNAIDELNTITLESGEYPTALFTIGEIYIKKRSPLDAIGYFNMVSSQFPEHELSDNALINLAEVYLDIKKGDMAMESVIKVIKNYDDRETIDDAYLLLGKILETDYLLMDFGLAGDVYRIFLKKSADKNQPNFFNSPLNQRVEKSLQFIVSNFSEFDM